MSMEPRRAREPWCESPLASELRTPEQMRWIHDRFKIDGLERLARAHRDYADEHGYYIPDVAALAHAALCEVARLHEAIALIDEPYPLEVFPDLQQRDAVFAAMREVNKYATEQFYAEIARARGRVVREHASSHGGPDA